MKILIISDSHGNIANLKAAMEIGKKADVSAVIHCGDWDDVKSAETVYLMEFLFTQFWEMLMLIAKLKNF